MTPEDYEKAVLQRFRTLCPPPRFVVKHNIRLSGHKTKTPRQVDIGVFETGKSQPFRIGEAKRHKRPIDAGIAGTGEGRERAKAQGVRMGRKPKLTDHQKREAIKRRDHGEETLAEIGRSYNVSGWTISRLGA